MPQHTCPKCHAQQARRIKQHGFFQQAVLRRLGYYPWECRFCKATFVLRDRGLAADGKRRPKGSGEADRSSIPTSAAAGG